MKIHYKRICLPGGGELLSISSLTTSESGKTVISADTRADRAVINGTAHDLTGSELCINSSDIKDGAVEISFYRGSKQIPTEPFIKCGTDIKRSAPTREEQDNILRLLVLALESIERLTDEQRLIKEKLEPPLILKFN